MGFLMTVMALVYLLSIYLYVEILVAMFEDDTEWDKELYAVCVGAGVLAFIYFALLKLDYVNMIFVGLYLLMFLGTESSARVKDRLEDEWWKII